MSNYLLCTRGLTKRFGHHNAVDHVDLHIPKGAIYGFIGRNGAGKTTCLKMISGLSAPTEGEIEIFGYRVLGGAAEETGGFGLEEAQGRPHTPAVITPLPKD